MSTGPAVLTSRSNMIHMVDMVYRNGVDHYCHYRGLDTSKSILLRPSEMVGTATTDLDPLDGAGFWKKKQAEPEIDHQ